MVQSEKIFEWLSSVHLLTPMAWPCWVLALAVEAGEREDSLAEFHCHGSTFRCSQVTGHLLRAPEVPRLFRKPSVPCPSDRWRNSQELFSASAQEIGCGFLTLGCFKDLPASSLQLLLFLLLEVQIKKLIGLKGKLDKPRAQDI